MRYILLCLCAVLAGCSWTKADWQRFSTQLSEGMHETSARMRQQQLHQAQVNYYNALAYQAQPRYQFDNSVVWQNQQDYNMRMQTQQLQQLNQNVQGLRYGY